MPEFDYSILKGKIVEKFGTQKAFADAVGMSERSLSLKLNNKIYFSQDEMSKTVQLFNDSVCRIKDYFFTPKVQEVEQKAG